MPRPKKRFARTREILTRRRGIPNSTLYILPNIFTSASLFLALFSLVKSAEGVAQNAVLAETGSKSFTMACWLIIGSAICDVLDGPVARWTRTASSFGLQYDSLADVVAFGVAPAFMINSKLGSGGMELLPHYAPKLSLGACALFAVCSAIRLARFNVQAATTEKNTFTGLPTPGAAGAVVTAYLFIEWLEQHAIIGEMTRMLHRSILLMMVGLALLMVSEVPFPKFKNLLRAPKNPINALVILVVVVCLLIIFQDALPVFMFGAFAVYVAMALALAAKHQFTAAPAEEDDAPLSPSDEE